MADSASKLCAIYLGFIFKVMIYCDKKEEKNGPSLRAGLEFEPGVSRVFFRISQVLLCHVLGKIRKFRVDFPH